MWENETIVMVTSLKKRILQGQPKVRFIKIEQDSNLPAIIQNCFQKRIERYIARETPLVIQPTPHFDLAPDTLESLKSRFMDVLRENVLFDANEVEDVLKESLVRRLDYLVKPFDTLRLALFSGRTEAAFSFMKEAFEPFNGILSYTEKLMSEMSRQAKPSLAVTDYDALVAVTAPKESEGTAAVLSDFGKLAEFLSETQGEAISRIDGTLLVDFLADRRLWGFRRALDVEIKLGRTDFDRAELDMTLKRYIELLEQFGERAAEPAHPKPQPAPAPSVIPEKPMIEENGWDLNEVMAQEPFTFTSEAEVDKPEEKQKAMRIVRKEPEAEPPVQMVQASAVLRSLIDEKTEKGFIKKLFGGDSTAYDETMAKLDLAESWRAAKVLIDNELYKRDVDPFSREAIKLVDMVYSRYYPEEGVGGKA
jgi:hypothetical protein